MSTEPVERVAVPCQEWLLNSEERAVVRSILVSVIARDTAEAIRYLDDHEERAA
jgi:hypothetical protein